MNYRSYFTLVTNHLSYTCTFLCNLGLCIGQNDRYDICINTK